MQNPAGNNDVFVVIPAFNEQATLRSVVTSLLPFSYSLVIVDDGSDENLRPLLKGCPVYYLRHKINLGQGAALQTGIEFSLSKSARYIVTFDADGQHMASDIERLLDPVRTQQADLVSGSRFMIGAVHNMPSLKIPLLQVARYLNYIFTGILLTDAHNGLRAMNRKAALAIRLKENGMAHATELLAQIKKHKLRYRELPVTIHYSDYSTKKGQTVWSSFRIFFDLLLNKFFK